MTHAPNDRTLDPALIARVAREVIERMRQMNQPPRAVTEAGAGLVTIATLASVADGNELVARPGAVVTPAARDEAARRAIRIVTAPTAAAKSGNKPPESVPPESVFEAQLKRRGVRLPADTKVLWSEQPAKQVFELCRDGKRAAMVTSFSDVERFAAELSPTAWVLDGQKLNLTAAVNTAARIAQIASTRPGETR